MKLSTNFLKDYLDIDIKTGQIDKTLGLELLIISL